VFKAVISFKCGLVVLVLIDVLNLKYLLAVLVNPRFVSLSNTVDLLISTYPNPSAISFVKLSYDYFVITC